VILSKCLLKLSARRTAIMQHKSGPSTTDCASALDKEALMQNPMYRGSIEEHDTKRFLSESEDDSSWCRVTTPDDFEFEADLYVNDIGPFHIGGTAGRLLQNTHMACRMPTQPVQETAWSSNQHTKCVAPLFGTGSQELPNGTAAPQLRQESFLSPMPSMKILEGPSHAPQVSKECLRCGAHPSWCSVVMQCPIGIHASRGYMPTDVQETKTASRTRHSEQVSVPTPPSSLSSSPLTAVPCAKTTGASDRLVPRVAATPVQDPARKPDLRDVANMSIGSYGHPRHCSRACKFFTKGHCKDGTACDWCHLCTWTRNAERKQMKSQAAITRKKLHG